MTNGADTLATRKRRLNQVIALICAGVFVGMIGVAYAAVPLYRVFCQVTGYGGTTRRVEQASTRVLDQTINIRFDANTAGVPWDFHPDQRQVTIKIGATREIHYTAQNLSDHETRGRATFNVTPEFAGAYFNKIQCFCFTDTTLKPGEKLDMPVVFYVDPDIVKAEEAKGLTTITLSYTMFPIDGEKPAAAGKPTTDRAQVTATEPTGNSDTHFGG